MAKQLQEQIFAVGVVILMVMVVAAIAAIPTIWALNTVFGLSIAYSAKTVFAVAILLGCIRSQSK